jgi:membrane-associated phospholipid phosphatase
MLGVMNRHRDRSSRGDRRGWRDELVRLDTAVYSAIAKTRTPLLDRALRVISRAADYSRLWLACSALLAAAGGPRGRRAAIDGLASVALTSAVVNVLLKPLAGRRRPDHVTFRAPPGRRVKMPVTRSFPSGHAASAFAFVAGVAAEAPEAAAPLGVAAAVVAYSRVHTGVHYPGDVIAGSLAGGAIAPIAVTALQRHRAGRSARGARQA